jgi:hypothetical protein
MISYPMLGRYGRLGNQLFQFASTYAASKKAGDTCAFPSSGHSLGDFSIPDSYFVDEITYDFLYQDNEQDFSFNDALHNLPKNTAIVGYLQNYKNFIEYRDDLIKMLEIRDEIKQQSKEIMSKYRNPIAVHVRRGDYLQIQDVLPCQSKQYYFDAMAYFQDVTPVIFTDDVEWCKNNFDFDVQSNSTIVDFSCMTFCNGHIISNSSYSWWPAFITGNKVVAPKYWFGPKGVRSWSGLYLDSWIVI